MGTLLLQSLPQHLGSGMLPCRCNVLHLAFLGSRGYKSYVCAVRKEFTLFPSKRAVLHVLWETGAWAPHMGGSPGIVERVFYMYSVTGRVHGTS